MAKAAQTAAELRKLADALDSIPEQDVPNFYIGAIPYSKEVFKALARVWPRPYKKGVDDPCSQYPYLRLRYDVDEVVTFDISMPRSEICTIKVPARPAEYDCPSILSPEEEAELEQA